MESTVNNEEQPEVRPVEAVFLAGPEEPPCIKVEPIMATSLPEVTEDQVDQDDDDDDDDNDDDEKDLLKTEDGGGNPDCSGVPSNQMYEAFSSNNHQDTDTEDDKIQNSSMEEGQLSTLYPYEYMPLPVDVQIGEGKEDLLKGGSSSITGYRPIDSAKSGNNKMAMYPGVDPSKYHVCPICGKWLASKSTLTHHIARHKNIKPYSCPDCMKTFVEHSELRQHRAAHAGYRAHNCPTCGKSFIQRSHLRKHLIIHTGIRAHVCSTCGRAFTQRCQLDKHMTTHSDAKPCACDQCGKCFSDKYDLRRHKKIHDGIKPHVCATCNKAFHEKAALKLHMYVHLGLKPHACPLCPKAYIKRSRLTSHMKTHDPKSSQIPILSDETATKTEAVSGGNDGETKQSENLCENNLVCG